MRFVLGGLLEMLAGLLVAEDGACVKARKPIFGLTAHAGLHRKAAAGEPVSGCAQRAGRNVERLQVLSAERAARRPGGEELDYFVNGSIGSHAHNAAAPMPAIPQVSLAVDGRSVRYSARKPVQKRLPVCDGTGGKIVVVDV